MFGKRTESPEIDRAVAQGISYELTLADQMRRSERRAWRVAACALAMSLVLAGGYVLFLPLKERVPYLVMADPYTGTASVARLSGDFHDRDVTMEEAINKSNVAQFVLARESYDSGLIGQRNWRTTLSMAGPAVAPAYINLHSEHNPERPFRIYGSARSVRTRILSIVLIGGGEGRRPSGATVRFQRSLYDKSNGRVEPIDARIATLEFGYNPDLRLSEEDRLLNPLGFRVTNYRVDLDFAAGPVPEREFPGTRAAAPAPSGDPMPPQGWPAEGGDDEPIEPLTTGEEP
ncbi:type IV secretion system protein [Luteimonas sp. 3794]|uniref:virB8 family protein n=1 Tax=Luteimonas sp. 3794 TaxID=2817730 RepID=UPI0028631A52|nr:type IV secretion system protein [Luteimonas sp. 3794]MDR6991646.1 type IV secretion system protein VirB8 [Luteimonas sp. 3794]